MTISKIQVEFKKGEYPSILAGGIAHDKSVQMIDFFAFFMAHDHFKNIV